MNESETIARLCKLANMETLDSRGNDALDFRTLHVDQLREIIGIAHKAGEVHGIDQARRIVGGTVTKPATLHKRHDAASTNELATAIQAAEDVVDPRSAYASPRRAVGFVEVKPGEEPERFDEFTGPMGGGQ